MGFFVLIQMKFVMMPVGIALKKSHNAKGPSYAKRMIFLVMRLLNIPIALGKFEKHSMNTIIAPFLRLLLVLQLLLSSYLVIGLDDGVSVCTFNSASSIADCSNRNTMLNQLPEAEKRLRYDPFPELFSGDAVDAFKRYRRFKREKSSTVDSKNKQHLDKNKKPIKKSTRIQEWDPDDGMKCIDISTYTTIIDFSCIYIWPSEFFHHTYDCFLGNYNLFKAAQNHNDNTTMLIVPYEETNQASMMPFVDFLLPKTIRKAAVVTHRYTKKPIMKTHGHLFVHAQTGYQDLDCFIVNSNAKILYTNLKTLWLDYWAVEYFPPTHPRILYMLKTAQHFQKAIQTATKSLQVQKSTDRTILFIHRSNNRILTNADAIVKAINHAVSFTQLHGQLRTTTFYGNETFTDTVLLFQQAAVVIAFHGAGLINTIYCPSDAVIVELSITPSKSDQKSNASEIWRSNHVIGTLCQLHWITYLLRSTTSLFRQDKEKLGYLFQTRLRAVTISQTDITRLATITKNKIVAIFSKSSSSLPSSKQFQGTYEVFTSKNLDTITPMNMFEDPENLSKQSALKPSEKGYRLDHDSSPVGRKRLGEKRARKSRKKTVVERETDE